MYDLLIHNGHVMDPESGLDAAADVAISEGRIAAVGWGLKGAAHVIDANGNHVNSLSEKYSHQSQGQRIF
jgi:predicted amidohydrolase